MADKPAGKGSKQRPLSVPKSKFDENFEKIFGKPPTKDKS